MIHIMHVKCRKDTRSKDNCMIFRELKNKITSENVMPVVRLPGACLF